MEVISMAYMETYKQWKNYAALDEKLVEELKSMKGSDDLIKDAFFSPLEFGTAGMRGVIGAGINRMNVYTVRQATEGLARLMESKGEEEKKNY